MFSVQESEVNGGGGGSPQRLVALFHARSSGYDWLSSHKGPVKSHSSSERDLLDKRNKHIVVSPRDRVMTYLGNS